MSHKVEYDELNGFEVFTTLASSSKDDKSLSMITVISETPKSFFRVQNYNERVHYDYDTYGDAIQAYNGI